VKEGRKRKGGLTTTNLAAVVQVGVEANAALAGRLKVHLGTLLIIMMMVVAQTITTTTHVLTTQQQKKKTHA